MNSCHKEGVNRGIEAADPAESKRRIGMMEESELISSSAQRFQGDNGLRNKGDKGYHNKDYCDDDPLRGTSRDPRATRGGLRVV
eukprot:gene25090-biopygen10397